MLRRMEEGWAAGYPFLVCETDGLIAGYAYGRRFRPRFAYLHSIEVSVYVKHGSGGRGVGTVLYERLLDEIRAATFTRSWRDLVCRTMPAFVCTRRFGFAKVAHFREVGRKVRPLDRRRLLAASAVTVSSGRCFSDHLTALRRSG